MYRYSLDSVQTTAQSFEPHHFYVLIFDGHHLRISLVRMAHYFRAVSARARLSPVRRPCRQLIRGARAMVLFYKISRAKKLPNAFVTHYHR